LVRVHQFLLTVGIHSDKVRFRQHLENEKAHYASDCWDAEILCSHGWIECVGNADRACYDLNVHARASGKTMMAFINYPDGPREEDVIELTMNKKVIGGKFKSRAKPLFQYLEDILEDQDELKSLEESFIKSETNEICGLEVTRDMLTFTTTRKMVNGRRIRPSVIEPSFGIGRIVYCLLEQAYHTRVDGERHYLTLKPFMAPMQCSIFPLLAKDMFIPDVNDIALFLRRAGVNTQTDLSGVSIGRKYSRVDELGCPFCITVDHKTLDTENRTVTIRERDTTEQVRVTIDEVVEVMKQLISGDLTWDVAKTRFPHEEVKE